LRNLDTIYLDPDLVRISQPKLISGDHFFGLQRKYNIQVDPIFFHNNSLCKQT
jgi:hypothetical protein